MFSDEIKKYTADSHKRLERRMIPLLKCIHTTEQYVSLLGFMYRYYKPLENSLHPFRELQQHHWPSVNIENDIRFFHPTYALPIEHAESIPVVDSPAKATGVWYVIEGSTLGGQIITKMLRNQLSVAGQDGFTFYNPYGDETMPNWILFREKLNSVVSEQERAEIVEGANQTFETLDSWISSFGLLNQS